MSAYIKKTERAQTNDLILHFKKARASKTQNKERKNKNKG
jgi:hypothetical protein